MSSGSIATELIDMIRNGDTSSSTWVRKKVEVHSDRTAQAISADLARYGAWCAFRGVAAVPASIEQLALFVDDLVEEGLKLSTIKRYLYSVGQAHDAKGVLCPSKLSAWKSPWKALLARMQMLGSANSTRSGELNADGVEVILASLGTSLRDLRDAALLAVASDTLCTSSELVAIRVDQVASLATGKGGLLHVIPPKTGKKASQESYRTLSPDTMRRISIWLDKAGIREGALFLPLGGRPKQGGATPPVAIALGAQEVSRIFRRRAIAAGLSDSMAISSHSTRIGAALDLARAGATIRQIQRAGGWRSEQMPGKYTQYIEGPTEAMRELSRRRG